MKLRAVFVAAMLLVPTAALAAPGIVTTSVNMKAGPGEGFPTVDRIPAGARVNIHGCIRGDAWCDVGWSGDRGWVSSEYLEYLYRNHYAYLPDYVDVIDVPIVPFVLSSYWESYYAGRPWFHRRAYWNNYWQSHARFATHLPAGRAARIGRSETRVGPNAIREQRLTRERTRAEQGRLAHVNGAGRTLSRVQQPIPRAHAATRFSNAPAARATPHIAQPNLGRANVGHVGGPPMNARAQMGGPRAAPAMPHVGGGGAPHINAAPRASAPAGGGGPGQKHH